MGAFVNDREPESIAARAARGRAVSTRRPSSRRLRPRARGGAGGAGPRQPHRRAHRLQRRLRAAVRDPARGRACAPRGRDDGVLRVRVRAGDRRRRRGATLDALAPGTVDGWAAYVAGVAVGARAARRRRARRSTSSSTATCRSARASRRPPRSSARSPVRCSTSPGADLRSPTGGAARAAGRERLRRRAERRHGPVRLDRTARAGHLLLLDCRESLEPRHVPFDLAADGLALARDRHPRAAPRSSTASTARAAPPASEAAVLARRRRRCARSPTSGRADAAARRRRAAAAACGTS